jgi:WD40 repeat protein
VAFGTINNQTILATAGYDNTVRLWDPATGQPIGEPLTDHTNPVTGVAFGTINNQTILATAGYDNTVRLWDPATGEGANLASRLRARFRRRGR